MMNGVISMHEKSLSTPSASADVDFDNLSDDDIDNILDDIDTGVYDDQDDVSIDNDVDDGNGEGDEDEANTNNQSDDNADNQDDLDEDGGNADGSDENQDDDANGADENDADNNDVNNDEDTEGNDDSNSDDDTNDQNDGDGDDTSNDDEDNGSENTPVKKDADEKDEGKDSETNDQDDGNDDDTVKMDQADFDKYKKFYDEVVNAEFTANGKTVKGFSDPAKIIQSQQMSYGFSDKMAGFKQYRPFMSPLKDLGMIDDPQKFNQMIDLFKGDKEAIKAHIKTLEIDPVLDLDLETTNYVRGNHLASQADIALEDSMEMAKGFGVEDRLKSIVGKEWDEDSFQDFVKDPTLRTDLITHIRDGVYDDVQDKIAEIKRTDIDGSFTMMKSSEQYGRAFKAVVEEFNANAASEKTAIDAENDDKARLKAEKDKIEQARKGDEYRTQVEANNKKAAEKRKRATSVSKKKPKAKTPKKFDPLDLEGDELDSFVNGLIGV